MHKVTSALVRNGISARNCVAPSLSTRTLHVSPVSGFKNDERGVAVKQEVPRRRPIPLAMDWKALERSWRYIKHDLKNRFASNDTQEQRKRLSKVDHVLYYFRKPEDFQHWYLMTDEDVGGYSWAELGQGKNEMTARFRGYLSQRRPPSRRLSDDPLQDKQTYNGFVYLETKPFITILDKSDLMSLIGFNVVKLRIRGDGRKYSFEMVCNLGLDARITYSAPVFTSGGPLWEEITIPYVKFLPTRKSSLMDRPSGMDINKIENFRFFLSDGIEGPFQLEIDYIALERDPTFTFRGTSYYSPWQKVDGDSGA